MLLSCDGMKLRVTGIIDRGFVAAFAVTQETVVLIVSRGINMDRNTELVFYTSSFYLYSRSDFLIFKIIYLSMELTM